MFNPTEIIDPIKEESTLKMIDAIVITGGEPTIYHELPFFIQCLRQFKKKIKLDTNGTMPDILKQSLLNGVDFVALDFKWPVKEYGYHESNFLNSLKIIRESKLPYQIRTTIHKTLLPPENFRK